MVDVYYVLIFYRNSWLYLSCVRRTWLERGLIYLALFGISFKDSSLSRNRVSTSIKVELWSRLLCHFTFHSFSYFSLFFQLAAQWVLQIVEISTLLNPILTLLLHITHISDQRLLPQILPETFFLLNDSVWLILAICELSSFLFNVIK